jgi:hypothetical protein
LCEPADSGIVIILFVIYIYKMFYV